MEMPECVEWNKNTTKKKRKKNGEKNVKIYAFYYGLCTHNTIEC